MPRKRTPDALLERALKSAVKRQKKENDRCSSVQNLLESHLSQIDGWKTVTADIEEEVKNRLNNVANRVRSGLAGVKPSPRPQSGQQRAGRELSAPLPVGPQRPWPTPGGRHEQPAKLEPAAAGPAEPDDEPAIRSSSRSHSSGSAASYVVDELPPGWFGACPTIDEDDGNLTPPPGNWRGAITFFILGIGHSGWLP